MSAGDRTVSKAGVLVARSRLDRAEFNLDFTRVAAYGLTEGQAVGENLQALAKWLMLGSVVLLVGLPHLWRPARRLWAHSWDRLLTG